MPSMLTIDDDNEMRTMLREKDQGFNNTLVTEAEEGVKSSKKNPADIVVRRYHYAEQIRS